MKKLKKKKVLITGATRDWIITGKTFFLVHILEQDRKK